MIAAAEAAVMHIARREGRHTSLTQSYTKYDRRILYNCICIIHMPYHILYLL